MLDRSHQREFIEFIGRVYCVNIKSEVFQRESGVGLPALRPVRMSLSCCHTAGTRQDPVRCFPVGGADGELNLRVWWV